MALKKDFTTDTGLTCTGAYIRVDSVTATKDGMIASVRWHKESGVKPFHAKGYSLPYDFNGKNAIAQAYDGLKILPEFAGAQDC